MKKKGGKLLYFSRDPLTFRGDAWCFGREMTMKTIRAGKVEKKMPSKRRVIAGLKKNKKTKKREKKLKKKKRSRGKNSLDGEEEISTKKLAKGRSPGRCEKAVLGEKGNPQRGSLWGRIASSKRVQQCVRESPQQQSSKKRSRKGDFKASS